MLEGQTNRRKAQEELLAALVKYGFNTRTYGTGFWQPLYVAYKKAAGWATATAQGVNKAIETRDAEEGDDVLEIL